MFSLEDSPIRLCQGLSRREWLRVGGLTTVGLSLTELLRREANAAASPVPSRTSTSSTFGRARSVLFFWLQGGPPQHETFDPKPYAPAEIRGPFKAIATNVPGIHFGELLPRTARIADKLAVVRSIATDDNNHDVSGYWVLTGYPYGPGSARQIKPNDWPYIGSVIKMLRPSEQVPALTSVWIPDVMRLNDNVTPAGQTAGFLGRLWEPERFVGDPSSPDYRVEGLSLPPGLSQARIDRRRDLLTQIDEHRRQFERGGVIETWDRISQQAYDLVTSGRAREAFDLSKETDAMRDRYGRHGWGQSVLLARRLIEAGVRLVHVNWTREPGDTAVDNPLWDTHTQNADRLQDVLCPQFDQTFPALIEDLESRGLLESTLVVVIGEFGRTPKINVLGGRDHWGHVFSFALAGAGIAGGQVYGASDKNGAYPAVDAIRPHDLTATIFHLLGIDHSGFFLDRGDRPHALTRGEPIARLLGTSPATSERTTPGGDLSFVPPYDARLLLDTDFASGRPLIAPSPATREKGWRADPIWSAGAAPCLSVRRAESVSGPPAVLIGFACRPGDVARKIPAGSRALLTQEIRNARGGQYDLTVRSILRASSREDFRLVLLDGLKYRLVVFRYKDMNKDPSRVEELASASFEPVLDDSHSGPPAVVREYALRKFLGATVPGSNFATGNGLGVAIIVEATRDIELPALTSSDCPVETHLEIRSVSLAFHPRPRDETVTE
ncbi:MAG: DUF1501 domain-containing protein [Isosphaeraceae bacterium]